MNNRRAVTHRALMIAVPPMFTVLHEVKQPPVLNAENGDGYLIPRGNLSGEFSCLSVYFHLPYTLWKKETLTTPVHCFSYLSTYSTKGWGIAQSYFNFSISFATNSTSVPTTTCMVFRPVFLSPGTFACLILFSFTLFMSFISSLSRVAQ